MKFIDDKLNLRSDLHVSNADFIADDDANGHSMNPPAIQMKSVSDSESEKSNSQSQGSSKQNGLPEQLKLGIESLSGLAMDDVSVHYNSNKPAQLNARAFAQGTDIHVGPNHEKHLAHEAWHVVQQKQGRVKPNAQLKSNVGINNDTSLELEADEMGARAEQGAYTSSNVRKGSSAITNCQEPIQCWEEEWGKEPKHDKHYPNLQDNPELLREPQARAGSVDKGLAKQHMKVHSDNKKRLWRRNGDMVRDGNYRYAVSAKGALYIELTDQERLALGLQESRALFVNSHPEILGNQHVQTAGYLTVKKGKIIRISNHSGHYAPTEEQHDSAVHGLKVAGMVSKRVDPEFRTENNTQYLKTKRKKKKFGLF